MIVLILFTGDILLNFFVAIEIKQTDKNFQKGILTYDFCIIASN